jgi:hypothetical protein
MHTRIFDDQNSEPGACLGRLIRGKFKFHLLKTRYFYLMSQNPANPLSKAFLKTASAGSKSDCFFCHFIFRAHANISGLTSIAYTFYTSVSNNFRLSLYRLISPLNRHTLSHYKLAPFKFKSRLVNMDSADLLSHKSPLGQKGYHMTQK